MRQCQIHILKELICLSNVCDEASVKDKSTVWKIFYHRLIIEDIRVDLLFTLKLTAELNRNYVKQRKNKTVQFGNRHLKDVNVF